MKKPFSTSVFQEQAVTPCVTKSRHFANPPPPISWTGPVLRGVHRPISYIPGEKPRKDPPVIPRLFIRGLGGSIKLDLAGVGIRLSESVFAYSVTDASLQSVHVRPGDIALIEPDVRSIRNGNLLLLELEGRPVIRRVRKKKRIWMLEPIDQGSENSIPLAGLGIQGAVIGFVRLFNRLRPIRYEGNDANYNTGFERPPPSRIGRARAKPLVLPCDCTQLLPSLKQIRRFIASNRNARSDLWLSEIDEAIRYLPCRTSRDTIVRLQSLLSK